MRAGLLIRQQAALRAASARPCPSCGHPTGDHRELLPSIVTGFDPVTMELREEPNLAYRPLHFHCHHEGCDCVQVAAS